MGSSCTKTQTVSNAEAHEGKENFQIEGEKAVNDTNVAAESKCQQLDKDSEAERTEVKDAQKAQGDVEENAEDAAGDDQKQTGAMGDDLAHEVDAEQKIAEDAEN